MDVFKSIMTGLNEAVEYEKGNLKARTHKITVAPLESFNADEIKYIRNSLGLTQKIFAGLLGVSAKTIEAWESGGNKPSGSASRILAMIKSDPTLPEKYNIVSFDERK